MTDPALAAGRAVGIVVSSSTHNKGWDEVREPHEIMAYVNEDKDMLSDLEPEDQLLTVAYLGDLAYALVAALGKAQDKPADQILREMGLAIARDD